MTLDAAAAKLGKTAIEASKKAVPDQPAQPLGNSAPQESPFKQLLTDMDSGAKFAESVGVSPADLQPGPGAVQAMTAEGITPLPEWLDVGGVKTSGIDSVVDMLGEVNQGQMKMDHFLNEILYGGKQFSNQELLAIQAHIYHFAQLTELTVKVAQEGVSSVKSILNTQVQ